MKNSLLTICLLLLIAGCASWIFYVTLFSARLAIAVILLIAAGLAVPKLSLNKADLGLEKDNFKQALPFTLVVSGLITVLFFIAYQVSPSLFLDERYDQSLASMLFTIFVIIPITTVLLEEFYFRGILLGFSLKHFKKYYALGISSLSFGLWHVFTAQNVSVDQVALPFTINPPIITIGIVLATAVAGLFFSWTRLRSGSLIAPMIIHWTINATGVFLSYLAWQ